ncbi:putative extracellular matrix protein [Cavenderia fasciculata]|uniref:Extracellular matrix protein n=1 Tax=Cavenderia fasciculata TaxID=261658 RepID=F4PWW9_CACFS|nr:putative extracellular matrix protein [Cavenderia fasciculata]EGG19772.1 putative extracellular matrix protein [Cavenderia fasciculata]|eukprot:XP_004358118.1 putative extracellular matrix protein [Cavenderia fasciculata]
MKFFNFILVQQHISLVSAQQTRTFRVIIYDHHPSLNPDFEYNPISPVQRGLASRTLNANGVPDFAANDLDGGIHNATTFSQWFTSTPGINIPIPFDFVFVQDPVTGMYTYINAAFFPINGMGWDALGYPIYQGQNFHFCLHFVSTLQFTGSEVFQITGDDDVWVYLNNSLALDLGGVHPPQSGIISLVGYTPGVPLKFDFFYCERHTSGSSIRIQSNFALECQFYDYCGICQGDGTQCCTPSIHCDDMKPCTIDRCPAVGTPGVNSTNFGEFCTHQDISCTDPNDKCSRSSCLNNQCTPVPMVCDPAPPCFNVTCDPSAGCIYSPIVCPSTPCTSSLCNVETGTCGEPIQRNCSDTDDCTVDSCDPIVGCMNVKRLCDDGNICTTDTCVNGLCVNVQKAVCPCVCPVNLCQDFECFSNGTGCEVTLTPIDDGLRCTIDSCNLGTGEITHIPINCVPSSSCNTSACDETTGQCVETPMDCNDLNPCTNDLCSNGTCLHTMVTCNNNTDKCVVGTCSVSSGCVYSPKDCNITDPCVTSVCSNGQCIHYPIHCPRGTVCVGGTCMVNVGRSSPPTPSPPTGCGHLDTGCEYYLLDPITMVCEPHDVVCQQPDNPCNISVCHPILGCLTIPNPDTDWEDCPFTSGSTLTDVSVTSGLSNFQLCLPQCRIHANGRAEGCKKGYTCVKMPCGSAQCVKDEDDLPPTPPPTPCPPKNCHLPSEVWHDQEKDFI